MDMQTVRDAIQLTGVAIVGIYMATCLVGFPLACAAAWYRTKQRARDIAFSQNHYALKGEHRRINS
jgi:hypothetical protein